MERFVQIKKEIPYLQTKFMNRPFKHVLATFVLFIFFLGAVHAKSILVEGGVENIVLLTNTEYLDGTPVIFFSEQLKDRIKEIIDKIDIVIVTGDDPNFLETVFLDETVAKKKKIIYILKSKEEEIERTNKRLNLEEFNVLKQKPKEEISTYKKEDQKTFLEYRKINPTRYLVKVKTSKSFWLVFSESFHEGWKAYVRKKAEDRKKKEKESKEPWSALVNAWKDRENRVELKDHFIANGYANSWWVPVKMNSSKGESNPKSFEIILEFKPQRLFEVGVFISLLTLICCLSYLVYDGIKRKRKKKAGKL